MIRNLDMVEQLGSGIPRILEDYSKECIRFSPNFLKISFASELETGGQAGGQVSEIASKLTSGSQKVFELILANPGISRKELSQTLGINESAVQKYLKILKEKKIIARVGTTTGYWKILVRE